MVSASPSASLSHASLAVEPVAAHDESVRSTKNFRQIRKWLAHCNRNHPECWPKPTQNGITFPPSRLIDVGGTDESLVQLVSGSDSVRGEQYTTLSYCWGGAQRLRLMSSNAVDLQKRVSYQGPPQNNPRGD